MDKTMQFAYNSESTLQYDIFELPENCGFCKICQMFGLLGNFGIS